MKFSPDDHYNSSAFLPMLVRSIILDALVDSVCPVIILLSGQGRAGSSFCAPGDHTAAPHLLFFSLQLQAKLQAEAAPLSGKVQKRRCWIEALYVALCVSVLSGR